MCLGMFAADPGIAPKGGTDHGSRGDGGHS